MAMSSPGSVFVFLFVSVLSMAMWVLVLRLTVCCMSTEILSRMQWFLFCSLLYLLFTPRLFTYWGGCLSVSCLFRTEDWR